MWNAILKFVLPIVVDIAIKYGWPKLIEFIGKYLPFIPKEVYDKLLLLVEEAIAKISGITPVPEAKAIAKEVRRQAKKEAKNCIGSMCVPDTK